MTRNLIALCVGIVFVPGALAAPQKTTDVPPGITATVKAHLSKKRMAAMPIFVRSASNQMAGAIRVSVNGDPVNFVTGEPVEADGRILVPMRGVFEALGAVVRYNDETQSIEAVRGDTTISLRPGDATATVNGEVHPLDSPVQVVNGAAVVPLRFVSETFGARVKWNAAEYEVSVSTDALVAKQLPLAPEGDSVFGMLTGFFPEARLLTVRLPGGANVRVPLTYDVSATRRTPAGGAVTQSKPVFDAGAIKLGEQVQIELNDKFEGLLVLVDTDTRRGEIKSIEALPSGGNQVTLTDGTVVALLPTAAITSSGRDVPLSAVKPAEKVIIRLNDAGQGISLAVTTIADVPMPPVLPVAPAPAA